MGDVLKVRELVDPSDPVDSLTGTSPATKRIVYLLIRHYKVNKDPSVKTKSYNNFKIPIYNIDEFISILEKCSNYIENNDDIIYRVDQDNFERIIIDDTCLLDYNICSLCGEVVSEDDCVVLNGKFVYPHFHESCFIEFTDIVRNVRDKYSDVIMAEKNKHLINNL